MSGSKPRAFNAASRRSTNAMSLREYEMKTFAGDGSPLSWPAASWVMAFRRQSDGPMVGVLRGRLQAPGAMPGRLARGRLLEVACGRFDRKSIRAARRAGRFGRNHRSSLAHEQCRPDRRNAEGEWHHPRLRDSERQRAAADG